VRLRAVLLLAVVGAIAAVIWHADRARPPAPTTAWGSGADAGPEPALAPPPAVDLSGRDLELELFAVPADTYAAVWAMPAADAARAGGADADLRHLVAAAAPAGVLYDPDLARAAVEVAVQTARLGTAPPEAALAYLLQASGCPESGAAVFVTHSRRDDDGPIADTVARALARPPAGDGPLRVGVGEAATPGDAFTRHVAVLVARRDWEMEPAPTHADTGTTWTLRVRLPTGWRDLDAAVLGPELAITHEVPAIAGDVAELAVPMAGSDGGAVRIAIDGTGPRGPAKLLQLTVWIGARPPRRATVHVPDADPTALDDDRAEARALELLLADRAAAGAPPLDPDAALARIARAHSRDMRDREFFGHQSPTTGQLVDRLAVAGYRAVASGENLARNDGVAEAQAALMLSVGHRANIVDHRFTHVGVGVARAGTDWLVTQVFARPVEALPADAAERLTARIATARAGRGLGPLAARGDLGAIALDHARAIAGAGVDGAADRIGAAIRPLIARAAAVSAHQVGELGEIDLPDPALDGAMTELGVGVWQDPASGRIGAVIIVAR